MSTFQPLGSRVWARPIQWEEITKGGLVLPENARERPGRARVVAIGPDVKNVMPGDEVLFLRYAATEFRLDDEDELAIAEKDLIGIFRE